jgi:phenylacetate-CoA ligase
MNGEYWQPEIETMPREKLRQLQTEKLRRTIETALNSPFYGHRLGKLGITPQSINSVDDIRKIPFTTKQYLRDNYPFGLVAGNMKDAIRIHSSSGTTGHPTVVVYSRHDIDSWANMIARNMYMVGCRDTDVFQNSSGYGMFTGGLGFQYGAERLGATTVPAAAGNSKRQIMFIRDFGTTCLHAIPSYAVRLAEVFKDEGIDPRSTRLHTLFIGAEPHTDEQRRRIEKLLGVKAYNSFGMTEMNGPGVAFECKQQDGMHLWEDNYIVEIVDPDTLEPVPDGEYGEMVLTTLDRTMMPILRYRTRDLTRIIPGKCACGRTHRRIDRIKGRTDDMFIIKGVNVFPMQVEKILAQFPVLGSNYLITLDTVDDNDIMTVEVELDDMRTDVYPELQKITRNIQRTLKDEILLTPKIKLVNKGSIPTSEGKAVRVKDLREGRGQNHAE